MRIKKAELIHDYLQLYFEDGIVMNVFNSFCVVGNKSTDFSSISEIEISSVSLENERIDIELSDGKIIQIGMQEKDYRGPEAIEFIEASGRRVVW